MPKTGRLALKWEQKKILVCKKPILWFLGKKQGNKKFFFQQIILDIRCPAK
jgi:hypothetical protein